MAEGLQRNAGGLLFLSLLADLADTLSAGVIWLASQVFIVSGAVVAEQDEVFAGEAGAIAEL